MRSANLFEGKNRRCRASYLMVRLSNNRLCAQTLHVGCNKIVHFLYMRVNDLQLQ